MLTKAIEFVIVALVLRAPIHFFFNMGWGLHFHKHYPGNCSIVERKGIGSEDFQILTSGLTFVTSGLSMSTASSHFNNYVKSSGKGSIQLLDMNSPSSGAKKVTIKHASDFNLDKFRPHGLSVLEDKVKGEHLIYVVNHVEGQADQVEKFRFLPKTKELRHEKSISSDVIRVINDLTLLDEDKLYVSNWLYFNHDKLMLLEHLFYLPLGGILYYNGTHMTPVKNRLFAPNGVILSQDKRYLYVSLPVNRVVKVYRRDSDHDLVLVQDVNIHTGLDNFQLSEDGNSLYGGCHPIGHKTLAHMSRPADYKSPSQVLRIPLKDGLIVQEKISEEFYDQGQLISGSSIAGVYKDKMLIGSVADSLVVCELPKKL